MLAPEAEKEPSNVKVGLVQEIAIGGTIESLGYGDMMIGNPNCLIQPLLSINTLVEVEFVNVCVVVLELDTKGDHVYV